MSLAGSCRWLSVLAIAACGFGTAFAQPAPVRFINEQLAAQWQEQGLTPAARCTDLEFLRRVSLDLLGRIPTLDEACAWERDARPDRRAALVDRLLASDEHADHWSRLWLTWLLGDDPPARHAAPLRAWLKEQITRNVSHRDLTHQLLTASGRSDANPAVHWLVAQLGKALPADKVQHDGQFDMVPVTGRAVWLFLGWQIQCVECHDHAFNPDWKQKHFWGINTFFRQLEHKPGAGDAAVFELRDNPDFNRGGRICYEAPCSVFRATAATYVDGRRIPATSKQSRRQELANFITTDRQFARAFINRLWGHFFGRGLNLRPDVADFGEHNEVQHPELLEGLVGEFAAARFDTRQLIHWLCASDAYQLRSTTNTTNSDPDTEVWFSRMPLRELTHDQLVHSLHVALRLPADANGQRLTQWRREVFRKPPMPVQDQRGFELPTADAWRRMLFLMNNPQLDRAVRGADSAILTPALLNRPVRDIVDTLCLSVLTRRATAAEQALLIAEVRKLGPRPEPTDLLALWQDFLWALFNSNEFVLRH